MELKHKIEVADKLKKWVNNQDHQDPFWSQKKVAEHFDINQAYVSWLIGTNQKNIDKVPAVQIQRIEDKFVDMHSDDYTGVSDIKPPDVKPAEVITEGFGSGELTDEIPFTDKPEPMIKDDEVYNKGIKTLNAIDDFFKDTPTAVTNTPVEHDAVDIIPGADYKMDGNVPVPKEAFPDTTGLHDGPEYEANREVPLHDMTIHKLAPELSNELHVSNRLLKVDASTKEVIDYLKSYKAYYKSKFSGLNGIREYTEEAMLKEDPWISEYEVNLVHMIHVLDTAITKLDAI